MRSLAILISSYVGTGYTFPLTSFKARRLGRYTITTSVTSDYLNV